MPSEYTRSIQKKPKGSTIGGEIETKTSPTLLKA